MTRFRWIDRPFPAHVTAAVLLLLAPFLLSCGSPIETLIATPKISVGEELAAEQVLNRQIGADPRTLDLSLATDVPTITVLADLFEGLVTIDEEGRAIPGVASSWDTSADGKTWTFHLRPNARWSNGQPVTADDFVYAWRREVNPATAAEYAQALQPIENAMEIATGKMDPSRLGAEAPDPRTLLVHMQQPTSYFLELLTNAFMFPLYEPAVKQWGDAWSQPGHMVSNGAFQLAERVLNGRIVLTKNPQYWDANHVRLTKINYYIVNNADSATDQYLSGSLDFTDRINLSQKNLLERTLGNQVVIGPYFGTGMLAYNLTKPPFQNNRKLRMALNMALDREIIAKYVRRGVGTAAYSLIPPLPGYDPAIPDWARLPGEQRHTLARKLYEEAGYSEKNPLETVLSYPSGGPDQRRMMEAMAAMWQMNLGAKIQIYNVEFKVLQELRHLKQPTLFWHAWIGDFVEPFTFMQLFQTGFGINDGGYENVKFDMLVNQAISTIDPARRFELYRQAEAILNEEAPYLPIFFYASQHLIKPYVKGWKPNAMDRNLSQYMYILAHQES